MLTKTQCEAYRPIGLGTAPDPGFAVQFPNGNTDSPQPKTYVAVSHYNYQISFQISENTGAVGLSHCSPSATFPGSKIVPSA